MSPLSAKRAYALYAAVSYFSPICFKHCLFMRYAPRYFAVRALPVVVMRSQHAMPRAITDNIHAHAADTLIFFHDAAAHAFH